MTTFYRISSHHQSHGHNTRDTGYSGQYTGYYLQGVQGIQGVYISKLQYRSTGCLYILDHVAVQGVYNIFMLQYVTSTETNLFQERTLAADQEAAWVEDNLIDNNNNKDTSNSNLIDDPRAAPFPFLTSASSSSGPAPVVYSVQQSKVRVYKPEKTTTTTTTSTTTTAATTTTTASTVRPFHYQLPPQAAPEVRARPPPQPQPQLQPHPKRPLVFAKRRPGASEATVSRPFEVRTRAGN